MVPFSCPIEHSPYLTDDIVHLILSLVPPHPVSISNIASVCRAWRSFVKNNQFLKNMLKQHTHVPFLGFFTNSINGDRFFPIGEAPVVVGSNRFTIPNNAPPFSAWSNRFDVLGCRHGKVLLTSGATGSIIVWNPMIKEHTSFCALGHSTYNNGAVICVEDHCHGHCHSSPWKLVWIVSTDHFTYATLWSSVSGSWEDEVVGSPSVGKVDFRPCILIGGYMYWHMTNNHIIEYDVAKFHMCPINCPQETDSIFRRNLHLFRLGGDAPGLAVLNKDGLKIWSLISHVDHGDTWSLASIIPWGDIIPLGIVSAGFIYSPQCKITAVLEDRNSCLIATLEAVFEFDFIKKSSIEIFGKVPGGTMFPYTSFFIPG